MACKDIDDLEVLQAYADYWAARLATDAAKREWIWPEKLLESRTGQAPKVCWRAMERCGRRGYLEWGVSLRGGWLTDKGARYLDDNRKWVKGGPRMVRDAAGGLVLVGSEAPPNVGGEPETTARTNL